MSKGWSPERRAAQAARCRQNKPWQKSTGPKTKEGKARASINAFKHGGFRVQRELLREMSKTNRQFRKAYGEFAKNEVKKAMQKQSLIKRNIKNGQNKVKNKR